VPAWGPSRETPALRERWGARFRCSANELLSAWSQKDFLSQNTRFWWKRFPAAAEARGSSRWLPEKRGGQEPLGLPVPGWDAAGKEPERRYQPRAVHHQSQLVRVLGWPRARWRGCRPPRCHPCPPPGCRQQAARSRGAPSPPSTDESGCSGSSRSIRALREEEEEIAKMNHPRVPWELGGGELGGQLPAKAGAGWGELGAGDGEWGIHPPMGLVPCQGRGEQLVTPPGTAPFPSQCHKGPWGHFSGVPRDPQRGGCPAWGCTGAHGEERGSDPSEIPQDPPQGGSSRLPVPPSPGVGATAAPAPGSSMPHGTGIAVGTAQGTPWLSLGCPRGCPGWGLTTQLQQQPPSSSPPLSQPLLCVKAPLCHSCQVPRRHRAKPSATMVPNPATQPKITTGSPEEWGGGRGAGASCLHPIAPY